MEAYIYCNNITIIHISNNIIPTEMNENEYILYNILNFNKYGSTKYLQIQNGSNNTFILNQILIFLDMYS